MRISLLKSLALFVTIYLLLFAQNALACSCYGRPSPYEAYREAKSVFIGKVIDLTDESGNRMPPKSAESMANDVQQGISNIYKYRFEVQESFKNTKSSEVIITKEINMCEYGFDIGATLLVYAYEGGGNLYAPTFCARTMWISGAEEDIHFIRDILARKPEPRIYGSVNLVDNDIATGEYRKNNLSGIKIIAKNQNNIYETVTDANGLYRFYKLPDGKYEVAPQLPLKYTENIGGNYERVYEITLRQDGYGYESYGKYGGNNAYSSFDINWNNSVSGTIVDAEGKSLEKAKVTLIPISQINKPLPSNDNYVGYFGSKRSEWETRKYEVKGKSPGTYVLAVEVFAPFASGESKLLMYYPQAMQSNKAQIINLKELDDQTLNIKLPTGYNLREIEGQLLSVNGTPLKNGYVSLNKLENPKDKNNIVYDSQSVKDGKFKFQVFENAEYWIYAKDGSNESKPFKVKVGRTNTHLKVVILPTIPPAIP